LFCAGVNKPIHIHKIAPVVRLHSEQTTVHQGDAANKTKWDNSMQLRTLALICSLVGLLYSGLASALGLGEITLKSQFNQPLNAEIRLLKVRDLSEEEILVALASRDDFNRAGVDRVFFLTSLNFEVVLDNPSNPFIRVTTKKPVTEPYLDFLVDVQWPSGRLLREYTLLLDLPVFTEAAPARPAVKAASSSGGSVAAPVQQSSGVRQAPPRSTTSAPTSRNESYSSPSTAGVDSYRVKAGDTLWEIAEKVRPSGSLSVNQTMIAIQQANSGAFIGDNINRLRNGRVLRIPSSDEIASINYDQAVASVRQQNQSWSSAQKAVLTSAAPNTNRPVSSSAPEGRLTLGAADAGTGDVKGSGASGSGDSLRNELATSQDALESARRQNSELQARVAELESQIDTMEKLVEVTNDQLKALQLATQTTPNVDAASDVATDTVTSVELPDPAVSESTDTSIITPIPSSPEPQSSPVVTSPQETSGIAKWLDIIKRNIMVIGGGLLALLIAILVLLRLREKPEHADFGEFDLAEEDRLFDADEDDQHDKLADVDDVDNLDDEEDSVQAQTEDVVAEADIYVSLGQEDKAIELLQKEIQQNPDNADARLGLLKIHSKAQDVSAFDEQYAQLLPLGNVYANDQANALRRDIQGVDAFDTDKYSPNVTDDELDFDLDLDLDLDLDAKEDSKSLVTDEELDFNLDDDFNIGDIALDTDELESIDGDSLEFESDDLSLDDLDDDLELDLDEDIATNLNDDLLGANDTDELSLDFDDELDLDVSTLSAEGGDKEEDDAFELDLDIDDALESDLAGLSLDDDASDNVATMTELDLDIDDDFAKTLDELDDDKGSDDVDFNADDLSIDIDDMDLDIADTESDVTENDEALNLDFPPRTDIDIASLDQEIDELTADLDEVLPLDMPAEDAGVSELEVGDAFENIDELASDLDHLSLDDSDEDLDLLADTEASSEVESEQEIKADLDVVSPLADMGISEDDDLDFLEASDEVSTKLDLAKAYLDMGDREGAEDILNEVMEEGNAQQKTEAQELIRQL